MAKLKPFKRWRRMGFWAIQMALVLSMVWGPFPMDVSAYSFAEEQNPSVVCEQGRRVVTCVDEETETLIRVPQQKGVEHIEVLKNRLFY